MRDMVNAPIFMRLGAGCAGPEGAPIGRLRRVSISNVVCSNAGPGDLLNSERDSGTQH